MQNKKSFLCFVVFLTHLFLFAGCSEDAPDQPTGDKTPPSTIANLLAQPWSLTSVRLSWTAPSDNDTAQSLAEYDIRYATASITEATWNSAAQMLDEPAPRGSGTKEITSVVDLVENTPYFFAVKTRDQAGNWSALSNTATETPRNFEVTIADDVLDSLIRKRINIPSATLRYSDLQQVDTIRNLPSDPGMSDLSGIEHCRNLRSFSAFSSSNQIDDLTPFNELTDIDLLSLNLNSQVPLNLHQIGNIVPQLEALTLDYAKINDISQLATGENLEYLYLLFNEISDLTPLENLTKIHTLQLSYNQISDISALADFPNLLLLYLADNQISNLSPLSSLTEIRWLNLADNDVANISVIADLTDLEFLYLTRNQVSDISALTGLTHLEWLDLEGNSIIDITPLVDNTGFGSGDQIILTGNPLSDQSINDYIPQLQARGATVVR